MKKAKNLLTIFILTTTLLNVSYSQTDSLNKELFKTPYRYYYNRYYNYANVVDLIKKGADINAKNKNGNTLLHLAVNYNNLDLAKLLCFNNANINIENNKGETAIDISEKKYNKSIFNFLKDIKYDIYFYAKYGTFDELKDAINKNIYKINKPDKLGYTVLDYAVCRKKDGIKIVNFLTEKGVDLNFNYINVLDIAILNDNFEIARHYSSPDSLKKHIRPINVAIGEHNFEMVKLLVEKGTDINKKDYLDYLPIFYACRDKEKNKDIIKYLIDKGVNINTENREEKTILHILCSFEYDYAENSYSDIETIKLIIKKGIDIESVDNENKTALHYAAENTEATEALEYLLKKGANQKISDNNGKTPFYYAIKSRNNKAVKLFIEHGADINTKDLSDNTLLHTAVRNNNSFDLVKLLLKKGLDINAENSSSETPLHLASNYKDINTIKLLLEKGAEINARSTNNSTPLINAVKRNNFEIVKILAEADADINVKRYYSGNATEIAVKNNYSNIAKYLINKNADLSNINLIEPIRNNNLGIVKLLILKGVDVNKPDENKNVPIIIASSEGNKEIIELLIKAGANLNVADNNYKSPVLAAIINEKLDIVKLLIENGANVKLRNSATTPLHYAAKYKDGYETVKILIENGANINAIDENYKTPLHYALRNENIESAELLKKQLSSKRNENNKNNLFPDCLILNDIIPLDSTYYKSYIYDNDLHNNLHFYCEDFGNVNFNNLYFNKITKGEIKAYSNYKPYLTKFEKNNIYNPALSEKEINEKFGAGLITLYMVDVETGEEYPIEVTAEANLNEIDGIEFYDDWFYNDKDFIFNKNVFSYSPIRHYLPEDYFDEAESRYKKIAFINFEKYNNKKSKKSIKKQAELFKKVKYEFFLYNEDAYLNKNNINPDINFQLSKYEKEEAPFWSSFSKQKIVKSVLNKVLSGKIDAYDFYTGQKLKITDIYERFGANEEIEVWDYDYNTGDEIVIKYKKEIYPDEIKSVIFIEDWYLDKKTLQIVKNVIGIAPVRRYENYEESDIPESEVSIPFVVYFKDVNKNVYDERKITVNTPIDNNTGTLNSFFCFDNYYFEKNINKVDFKKLFIEKTTSGEVKLYQQEIFEDKFGNYTESNYLLYNTIDILKNIGIYNDTIYETNLETDKNIEKIVKREGYGTDSVSVIHSHEKWNFNKENFTFNKEIFAYSPGIRFYRDDDIYFDEPKYKLIGYILNNQSNKPINKMSLFKKVKYEFWTENPMQKEIPVIPEIEKNRPLFWSSYNQSTFKEVIFNSAVKGEINAYNFYSGKKLSSDDLMQNLNLPAYIIEDVDPETGDFIKKTVQDKINPKDINSFIFIENWYVDEKNLSMKKEVVGIAPVIYYSENNKYKKIIPFVVYFDESKRF
ncbi:MAG: ankyrin repeat domain-containing protein [Bacteroidales bacterium]|nr:ankyrin repeat domain-containing protein [Bacteroidales bacterium]